MFFNFRLLLSKVHISLDALTIWRNVRKIQKAPFVSLVLGGIDSDPLDTSILVNLLHWEGNRQQQNCQETGFPWVTAPNGFGIQSMPASK